MSTSGITASRRIFLADSPSSTNVISNTAIHIKGIIVTSDGTATTTGVLVQSVGGGETYMILRAGAQVSTIMDIPFLAPSLQIVQDSQGENVTILFDSI